MGDCLTKKGLLLHVGCGGNPLPDYMGDYKEVRLDIDESHNPDIVADMTELGGIGGFDVVWCCHALEHLDIEDVAKALSEFRRVLNTSGMAILLVPDMEDARATREVLFVSQAGPITGLDLTYGLQTAVKKNPYMRHLTGFTKETLKESMEDAGFKGIVTKRLSDYNLMGVGIK